MFRLQEFFIQEPDAFQAEKSLGTCYEDKIVCFQNLDLPLVSCVFWAS